MGKVVDSNTILKQQKKALDPSKFDAKKAAQELQAYWHAVAPRDSGGRSYLIDLNEQISRSIVTHSALIPGQNILSLSCDMGEVLRALVNRLGGRIRIVNVDPIAQSLHEMRNRVHGGSMTSYISADFNCLPFIPQSFDRIISRFAMNGIEDLRVICDQLYNLLKPEGIISVVVLDKLAESPLFRTVIEQLVKVYPGYERAGFDTILNMGQERNVADAMKMAGFRGIRTFERTAVRKLPVGLSNVWFSEVSLFLGHYIAALPKAIRSQFIEDVTRSIAPYRRGQYYMIENTFTLTTAMR